MCISGVTMVSLFPGWPQKTGRFVSSSCHCGFGWGWSTKYCWIMGRLCSRWRSDGSILPGWPKPTGHFVWSTPVVKDLNGDGILEVSWSPARFISGARTVPVPGWPQKIGGYSVSGSRRGSDDVASEVIVGRNNSTPG